MARLKGTISSKKLLILLAVVMLISIASLFPVFIFALSPVLTVRVSNIETGYNITGANVSLINCSNGVLLNYSLTSTDGLAVFQDVTYGPFKIEVNISLNYYNKTDDNSSSCYLLSTDTTIDEEVYRIPEASFNLRVADSFNNRPVPNAQVKVLRWVTKDEVLQTENYRCSPPSGVCKTDENGEIMLIVSSEYPDVNFYFNATNENYQPNETGSYQFPGGGKNSDVTIKVKGSQTIDGYVKDAYNTDMVIPNAFVTLWNHSNPGQMFGYDNKYFYNATTNSQGYFIINIPKDLVTSTDMYDVNVTADGYLDAYEDNSGNGYYGGQSIPDPPPLKMTGVLNITGKAIDLTNGQPISGADVNVYNVSENFTYITTTDSNGNFELKIKNNTGYTLLVNAAGYNENNTYSALTGLQDLGNITLLGNAHVIGTAVDKSKDVGGNDIAIGGAGITLSAGGKTYSTVSGSDGSFSIYVKSQATYSISVTKPGYFTNVSSKGIGLDPVADVDLGIIELAGEHRIYGTVYDYEQAAAVDDTLESVSIYVIDVTANKTYKADPTGTDGQYSINISSDSHNYSLRFEKYGYFNVTKDGFISSNLENPENALMYGSTYVRGKVADEYSPSLGNTIPLAGAVIEFRDLNTAEKMYEKSTNSTGDFKIYMGVTGDYYMLVSKSGYTTGNFSNDGDGFSAFDNLTFDSVSLDYLRLRGTTHVQGNVKDGFSGMPVYQAVVSIYLHGQGVPRYWNDSLNGIYDLWVDGNLNYDIEADAYGYPRSRDSSGYSASMVKDFTLTAWFHIVLDDAQNDEGIQNARVRLYHYYNQTSFGPYNMTPTTYTGNLSVYVTDNESNPISNVLVTVENATSAYSGYTVSGWANFTGLLDLYNITANGTRLGYNYTITQNFNVIPLTENITSTGLGSNTLRVHVYNSTSNITGANVTLWNLTAGGIAANGLGAGLTGLTNAQGLVNFDRLIVSAYNMTVEVTGEDMWYKTVGVSINENTEDVVFNDTEPPQYSLVTDNSSGSVTAGDTVLVSAFWTDGVALHYATLSTNKSGAFQNESFYAFSSNPEHSNFTIDTTGYDATTIVWVIYANDTTGNTNQTPQSSFDVTPTPPVLTVYVNDTAGSPVGADSTNTGANVTISNSSYSESKNTSTVGYVVFTGLGSGTYNLTINGSNQGYGENQTENYVLGYGQSTLTVILDITTLIVNVTDQAGSPVNNANVTLYNSSDNSYIAKNATGGYITGLTDASGFITFERVLPCTNCNLTVNKSGSTPSFNYTYPVNIAAGQNLTIQIDPYLGNTTSYYIDTIGDNNSIQVNASIAGVNVSMLGAGAGTSTVVTYNISDASGIAHLTVEDGVYDIRLDGSNVGQSIETIEGVKIGKLVFNMTTTGPGGHTLLRVDGQPVHTPLEPSTPSGGEGYYARIDTAGYGSYDTLEQGVGIFKGTYYNNLQSGNEDVNNSFQLSMYGLSKISGNILDINCKWTNCSVPATVKVSAFSEQDRYSTQTEDGSFSFFVSPCTSSSPWDNPTYTSYSIKINKPGYQSYSSSWKTLSEYENYSHDPQLKGAGYVWGYVYHKTDAENRTALPNVNVSFVVNKQPSANPIIEGGSTYYKNISVGDGDVGFFYLTTNPNYSPYNLTFQVVGYVFAIRGPFNGNTENLSVYMFLDTEGGINFHILDEDGNGIAGASLLVVENSTGTVYYSGTTDENGEATTHPIDTGNYDVTINATHMGYSKYQGQVTVNSGQETIITVTLPSTKINVTLKSDTGEPVDDVAVSLWNGSGLLDTKNSTNGSAVFAVLLAGEYNVTFSGYKSRVYYLNGETLESNTTMITITESLAGITTNLTYVLNETRAVVKIVDYNSSALPNITVTLSNVTDNSTITYNVTSDENGYALFREILPAHNYTITFNETQLHDKGLVLQLENFSIAVYAGEDENTTNNITIVIGDVYVRFNVTNVTGQGIENVTISLLEANGSVAFNDYGEALNGTTSSSGILFIHGVPNRTYSYEIDANESGYGIWNGSINVTLNNEENWMDKTDLSPITLTVFAYNSTGGPPLENVTVLLFLGNVLAKDANGENVTANITISESSVNLTHLLVYSTNYTVNVTSSRYFGDSSEVGFGLMNPDPTLKGISFTLTERKITVIVRNSTGDVLEEGVNTSITNSTGYVIRSLNGSYLNATDITDSVDFTHLPDGEYVINVSTEMCFSSSQTFNVSDILLGIDTYNFTMIERTVYIYLREADGTTLDYGVNVSLTNSTGGQLISTNGSVIETQTGKTDTATFNYVPDGINHIVSVVSNDYFSQNWTFNTTELPTNNTHTFIMRMRALTVNIYHLTGDVITEDVAVNVLNETGDVAKNRTGQFVNGTTNTSSISFTGIEDGTYNISLESANYTSKNVSFEPASGDNNQVDVYLLKPGHGYFNVTVLTSGSPLSGATVTLRYNGTTGVDSRDTGSDGIAVVETNISVYGQNLTIKVSRSGYYDNETEQYDISDQEVKDVVVTLTVMPPPPPGGKRGGYVGGPAVDTETQKLGDISANIAKSAKFSKSDTLNIEEIEVLTDQDASNVKITVKAAGKPAGAANPISSAEGKVHKYLDITATNLPNSIISRVTISFKVSRSWVDNNGIDPTELFMFRYYGGAWDRLETTLILQDSKWYYYRSTSPGFSIFAIGGYKFKEKGMELVLSPLSIKGSECRTAYITVKNTGLAALTNLHIDPKDIECCSFQPVKGITSLASGSQNTISVEICASRTTERGTYEYSLAVVSDQLTDTVNSKIYVTESYLETLTKQIEELEDELEKLNKTQLNETGLGYYNLALEKIDDSKDYLSRQDFDAAITLLGEAKEYYAKIQVSGPPAKGYLDMFLEWIMINYVLASAAAAIIVFSLSFLFIKRKVLAKELPEMPGVPTGGEVVTAIKKAPDEVMDTITAVVKELEAKVDEIDIDTLRERERKWYNKVKLQIENIKKSVEKGEFDKAKRNLNDAELFMKMLELNTASD